MKRIDVNADQSVLLKLMAVEVNEQNFQAAVIEKSHSTPVLVDFWAEWCGPCRMLTPVLEKVEADFAGRFILAKLNTDHNQTLAAQFQISGIPACKLFVDGVVVDEFTGALPEPAVRKFLEGGLPDPELNKLLDLARTNPVSAADQVIQKQIKSEKAHEILWKAALTGLMGPDLSQATVVTYLNHIPEIGSPYSDPARLLRDFFNSDPSAEEIAIIKKLYDSDEHKQAALDHFLQNVENSKGDEREEAKKKMLAAFQLLGNNHPLVNEYRRKLSSILF